MKRRVLFLWFVSSFLAAPVLSQIAPTVETEVENQPWQVCLEIENSLARLACYDLAFDYSQAEEEIPDTSQSGGWQFVEQEDQFSNQNTSFVVLRSDQAGRSFSDAPAELYIRCNGSGGYEAFVASNGYIGARNDRIPVRFRFGDDPPVSESWNESTSGTAAFLPRGYRDFLAGLETRQNFVFEITDYRGSRYSAEFDGLAINDDLLEFVLNGCQ